MRVTGARVMLRDMEAGDLDPFVEWMRPHHRWHATNAPYLPIEPIDDAQVERMRARIAEGRWDTPRSRLIVADAATGAMIGNVSRYWESVETNWLAVGIIVYDPAHWGRGLGTEALGLWTDYLFAEMPQLARLGLRTWSGNVGMMRVAERVGYVEEARFRRARVLDGRYYDALGYGVLREEWASRRPEGVHSVVGGSRFQNTR